MENMQFTVEILFAFVALVAEGTPVTNKSSETITKLPINTTTNNDFDITTVKDNDWNERTIINELMKKYAAELDEIEEKLAIILRDFTATVSNNYYKRAVEFFEKYHSQVYPILRRSRIIFREIYRVLPDVDFTVIQNMITQSRMAIRKVNQMYLDYIMTG